MDDTEILARIYGCFNARDIDGVMARLAEDVRWANGMDGGHERGRAAVRAYWTRQWALVDPRVEPLSFREAADGTVVVEVLQSVRDLDGRPLRDETHGLRDKKVAHVFRLRDGLVTHFDIRDIA